MPSALTTTGWLFFLVLFSFLYIHLYLCFLFFKIISEVQAAAVCDFVIYGSPLTYLLAVINRFRSRYMSIVMLFSAIGVAPTICRQV